MKAVYEHFYHEANKEAVGVSLDDTIENLKRIGMSSVAERMKYIQKYAESHSGYPFLSFEKAKHLCEKHGLEMKHVSWYIGSIPLKNLNDICRFIDAHPDERQMQICAPPHEFEEAANDANDPIVLCPVDGGYLIITAWGPEAFDPIISNALNN